MATKAGKFADIKLSVSIEKIKSERGIILDTFYNGEEYIYYSVQYRKEKNVRRKVCVVESNIMVQNLYKWIWVIL